MQMIDFTVSCIDSISASWPPTGDQLVELRGALTSTRAHLVPSSELGSLRQVVASNVIDRTFDDHRALLRKRLEDAETELRLLRNGSALANIEAERDEALSTASKLSLELSQVSVEMLRLRRDVDDLKAQSLRPREQELLQPVHFFRMMMHLVTLFSFGDMWQDAVGGTLADSIGCVIWYKQSPIQPHRVQPRGGRTIGAGQRLKEEPVLLDPVPYGSGASAVSRMPILPRIPSNGKPTVHRVAAHLAKK